MSARKRKITAAVCFGLSMLCMVSGVRHYVKARGLNPCVTIQSGEEGFAPDRIREMLDTQEEDSDDEDYTFAAWKEYKREYIYGEENGRGSQVNVIAVYGSSHCLLPYGKNLQREDADGCIIGMKLAEDLFGSRQAEGQKVVWQNRVLIVRGVVGEPSELFLAEKSDFPENFTFDRISCSVKLSENRKWIGENFISRYGLDGELLRWDYYEGPGWLKELIPGKWSDFGGWKDNINEKKQDISLMKGAAKSDIEILYINNSIRLYCDIGLAIVLLCAGLIIYIKIPSVSR